MSSFKPGDRVSLRDGRLGTVKYCGQVMFGPAGVWVGIELDSPTGKNNGSVDGMSYFTCKDKHGLFVQPDRVSLVRAAPTLPAPLPASINLQQVSTPVRPFEITETTSRLVKLSKDFSAGDENNRPTPRSTVVAPSTPQKNILDMSSMAANNTFNSSENIMATAIKANVGGTPGSNALSRELMRRQDEVNMLRKQVEPLLYQAKRVASAGGPTEHLKVLVDRIAGMMEQYDKVVSRYERQLQKLILHMDKRRAAQQANQAESERSIVHQLSMKERQVEDLKERLTASETQMRLLRKEYEQAQRNLSMRLTIDEETNNELAQLRSELDRLRKNNNGSTVATGVQAGVQSSTTFASTGTQTSALVQEQIEMLTAALETSRQENQELKRQRELLYKPESQVDSHAHNGDDHRMREVLKAKDRQEAYFTELIETLKKDHAKASETLQSALSQARSDLEETRHHLEEQSQRALKYSQAIDQTSDKCYQENRQLIEQLESLQNDLRDRNTKMAELADVTEQLRSEREERDQQIRKLEQKLVGMSSSMARSASTGPGEKTEELSEARKQIRLLEQTILDLSENKGNTLGKEEKGRVELLQRQLAQVEFEKQQIEATLKQERQQKPIKRSGGMTQSSVTRAAPVSERAEKIKAELEALKPAVPKLMDRLSSLFSALQTKQPTVSATPLNLDAVNRAYTDIKHSFEGLEASRQKALSSIHQAGNQVNCPAPNGADATMIMQDGRHVDRTPTMIRMSFGGHPPL